MFVADLHAHLPMYVPPTRPRPLRLGGLRAHAGDLLESTLVAQAGRDSGNFLPGSGEPRVDVPQLERGGARLVLSVLYSALDEFASAGGWLSTARRLPRQLQATRRHVPSAPSAGAVASLAVAGAVASEPPSTGALARLIRRLENVERHVEAHHGDRAAFAHDAEEVQSVLDTGRLALVHCVEGGFHLGGGTEDVRVAIRELGRRGVAYVTLGHLFFRGVATVAPAIPYLGAHQHDLLFPQPEIGLTVRAHAAIEAMVEQGVLLDVCHLSPTALTEAFELLDALDPRESVPVIASHAAVRFGTQQYNLDEATIARIAARGGVIGLILATHQLADGVEAAGDGPGLELLFSHVDRIAEVTGSHRHTAIGSDLGGLIEPLPDVQGAASLATLGEALERRYGPADAGLIIGENVRDLIARAWRPTSS